MDCPVKNGFRKMNHSLSVKLSPYVYRGRLAREYDRMIQATFLDVYKDSCRRIVGRADMPEAGQALDIGCGPGHVTLELAGLLPAWECVGADLSEAMVGIAGRQPGKPRNVSFVRQDVQDMRDFADESFDLAVSTGSIKHWPDPLKGIEEIHRVLKPGGRAWIGELDSEASILSYAKYARRMPYPHWALMFTFFLPPQCMALSEMERLVGKSGFGRPESVERPAEVFWLAELKKKG